ncbi:MAG TPA: dihydroorotate dehydrogenase-like protein [Prolixibacteraceae bacterium]|nr:dihydroorotate dehydrogenase-like protein [Prolixibacteraceae bacterium]
MANLTTRFFGLELKSPIVVGSSGLTSSLAKIGSFEENGAGAVVLKSIFEEEIYREYQDEMSKQNLGYQNLEYLDYFDYEIKNNRIDEVLNLISGVKQAGISIPVVASINCFTGTEWIFFARKLQDAGADALELNFFVLPSNINLEAQQIKTYYFQVIEQVLAAVSIPVSIKISPYFSDLARTIKEFSETRLAGITLFNRFYNIDIDLEKKELVPAKILSSPFEYLQALRWIGIVSGRVECDLAASTGIHDYPTALKMILAGASAVQVVSGIYKHGPVFIREMADGIARWMDENGHENLCDLIGSANSLRVNNPSLYERVQFMKHFGTFTGEKE